MKKIFVTSNLTLNDLEFSPKSVVVTGVTFFPIKHDKVKMEGKNPYFLVAGTASVTYNGSSSVFPFSIKGTNQSHLKGNLSPTTQIPKEKVLVSPQEKVITYKFKNSDKDLEGFSVKLKLTYVTNSISKEIVIEPEESAKIKGVVSIQEYVYKTEDGISGLNTSAEAKWIIEFRSSEPVDDDGHGSLNYHVETREESWSPSKTKEVPITDMAVGVMQPYISEGDSSAEVPVVFVKWWSSTTISMSAKVKSFTEKVKSN